MMLRKRGKKSREASIERTCTVSSLPHLSAPPRLRDADEVLERDQQVHHSKSRHEAANERIGGHHGQGGAAVQQGIESPETRPGNDQKKEAGLDAVKREEERHGHRMILNELRISNFELTMKN